MFLVFYEKIMKKPLVRTLGILVLIVIICILVFNRNGGKRDNTNLQFMVNEVSSYKVDVKSRWDAVWEDIFVYDEDNNLVLSLEDKNQPQYLFVLYGRYLVLDSGTSASQRDMLVYDIPSGNVIYKTDYYPWENWLVLDDDNITFYKAIDQSLYWGYTLPNCENGYYNGYIENYGYKIWGDQAKGLWDIQCAYFE